MAHVFPCMVEAMKPPMQARPMNTVRPYHTQQPNTRQRRLRHMLILISVGIAVGLGTLRQLPISPWLTQPPAVSGDLLADFPQVILWAWERPELLDFIDPHAIGVAF